LLKRTTRRIQAGFPRIDIGTGAKARRRETFGVIGVLEISSSEPARARPAGQDLPSDD
jgi:hypothetical protein